MVAEVEEGNQPTDPNAPAEAPKRDSANVRPEFAAAGGDVGGYNRGWLDPGHSVMRVGGEPRTSLLITKDGQVPRRKNGTSAPVNDYGGEGSRGPLGSFDNYEQRPLGERCIAFGRAGASPGAAIRSCFAAPGDSRTALRSSPPPGRGPAIRPGSP